MEEKFLLMIAGKQLLRMPTWSWEVWVRECWASVTMFCPRMSFPEDMVLILMRRTSH